ncbi:hypothetical protein U6B65_13445 [Oscillospiraceae bacterium MB08-C2-2]|nr:hypothetical protein U6B65_13445 [Oscillospiraceae bacterium MB08-C2-2]
MDLKLIFAIFLRLPVWVKVLLVLIVIGIPVTIFEKIREIVFDPIEKKENARKELEALKARYGSEEKVEKVKSMWEKIRMLNDKNLILTIGLGGKENIRELKENKSYGGFLDVLVWDAEKVRMDYIEAVYTVKSIEYGIVKLNLPYSENADAVIKSLQEFWTKRASEVTTLKGAVL